MNAFETIFTSPIQVYQALIAAGSTLVLSIAFALLYVLLKRKNGFYKDMPITYMIMPIIMCILVMAISAMSETYSGTVEAARYGRVAIAIVGGLIILRFRSEQRNTEDLTYMFFLTAVGFLLGMGYILVGIILYVIVIILFVVLHLIGFPNLGKDRIEVKITVPENLNYEEVFDDIFKEYTKTAVLLKAKSSDLGSLFVLTYDIQLKKEKTSKEFVDKIRERNGNLDVIVTQKQFLNGSNRG